MAVRKLSEIAPAGSSPALTDQLVGVAGGTTDNLFTVNQLASAIPINATALNLSFFVRTPPVSCTISATNPGVVTAIAHGLQANDPVAFSIIRTWVPVTSISNGSPAVVTLVAHGLAVGDPIAFINSGNGVLNTGITANTTYYVANDANFSASTFAFSDTQAHALAGTGQINTSSAGTGTQVFYRSGALPPNVTEGAVFYVISPTVNTFEISATVSGSAINCTGTQNGYFVFSTGNDNNTGLDRTRTGAWMTIQHAANFLSDSVVTEDFTACYLSDGTYLEAVVLGTQIGGSNGNAAAGFGIFSFSFIPENVIVRSHGAAGGHAFAGMGAGNWSIGEMTLEAPNGYCVINFGINTHIFLQTINFGNSVCPILSGDSFDHGGEVYLAGSGNKITWVNQSIGFFADKYGYLEISHGDLTFCVNPQWPYFIRAERGSNVYTNLGDFTYINAGVFTGSQLFVDTGATIEVKLGAYTSLPGASTNNMIEGGWVSDTSGTVTYIALQNRTWYVATTGNNTNPGTLASPFASIQYAVNIAGRYNWSSFAPTIQIADGAYTENNIIMPELAGAKYSDFGHIIGNAATPTNVTVTDLAGNGIFFGVGARCKWTFKGLALDSPFNFFNPFWGANFRIPVSGLINITDSTAGNNCTLFNVQNYGTMEIFGNVTITGSVGGTYAFVQYNSLFDQDTTTLTLPVSLPHLQTFFVGNSSTAYFLTTTVINSGGLGGSTEAFFVTADSVLFTNNGLQSQVPGNLANSFIDATSAILSNGFDFATKVVNPTTQGASGKADKYINTVTTGYTIALQDAGNIVQGNSGSPLVITVPAFATTAFPIGTIIEIAQIGAGSVSVSAAVGVTIVSIDSVFAINAINGTSFLEKVATNTWRFSRLISSGAVSGLTVGTTTITGGLSGGILYDSGPGILEESSKLTFNGTNTIVLNTGNAILNVGSNWFSAGSGNAAATGTLNVGDGQSSLANVTTGGNNLTLGSLALFTLTTASFNVAVGVGALQNCNANSNLAIGASALGLATSASFNTAIGEGAMGNAIATGANNVALGQSALENATSAATNIAIGASALRSCDTGSLNVSIGNNSGIGITSGYDNVFIGEQAGVTNPITGFANIIIGAQIDPGSDVSGIIMIGSNYASRVDYNFTVANQWTFNETVRVTGDLYTKDASFLIRASTSLTNGAGVSTGTLGTAPSAGNPTKWIPIDDAGVTRFVPAW